MFIDRRHAVFIVALAAAVASPAAAATVTIDGAPVTGAIAQAGHLLVPFRAPMEQLGATVAWSDATQTGTATAAGRELVRVTVGNETAYIDGNAKSLTVAPVLVNHLEYVPVEMLPEISNAQLALSADGATATVTNFDLAGVDAAGVAAASVDPQGRLLLLWVWLLPISAAISALAFFLAIRRLGAVAV